MLLVPTQIEQSVKLCRFLACTAAGTAASAAGSSCGAAAAAVPVLEALKAQLKAEVDAAVGFILENLAALTLMEDRAVALAEAAQVRMCGVFFDLVLNLCGFCVFCCIVVQGTGSTGACCTGLQVCVVT